MFTHFYFMMGKKQFLIDRDSFAYLYHQFCQMCSFTFSEYNFLQAVRYYFEDKLVNHITLNRPIEDDLDYILCCNAQWNTLLDVEANREIIKHLSDIIHDDHSLFHFSDKDVMHTLTSDIAGPDDLKIQDKHEYVNLEHFASVPTT